jgi:CheY-like chemotaxis protein
MHYINPILIVEDDEDDCELIQSALNDIGVRNEQRCFKNGEEALKYLKNTTEKTFLILSDVNMPLLNGFQLKTEINKDDELRKRSIPFVFLSTSANPKEVREAYEMMVHGFFKKPTTFEGIKEVLHTVTHYWNKSQHPNAKI